MKLCKPEKWRVVISLTLTFLRKLKKHLARTFLFR